MRGLNLDGGFICERLDEDNTIVRHPDNGSLSVSLRRTDNGWKLTYIVRTDPVMVASYGDFSTWQSMQTHMPVDIPLTSQLHAAAAKAVKFLSMEMNREKQP